MKMNGLQLNASTWRNLGNLMLSEKVSPRRLSSVQFYFYRTQILARLSKILSKHISAIKQFLKKLNMCLPYDQAISLLGSYPKGIKTWVHTKPLYMNAQLYL